MLRNDMTYEQFMVALGEMNRMDLAEAMTRSVYADFMKKGIKGLLIGAYAQAALDSTFQELVVEDSSDAQKEDYPSLGDPSMPRLVLEGENFDNLSPGSPDNVAVTSQKFGGIISITAEAKGDDQSVGKELGKQGMAMGRKHVEKKDQVVYSILINNPAIYDGGNFFALNHPGYTGGATRADNDNIYTNVTLSANALAAVLGIIAKWEGADVDQDLDIRAEKLVVPVTLQQTAYGLTRADLLPLAYAAGPLGPATTGGAVGMPNYLKGKLAVVSSARLDKSSTTDWYVKTVFPGLLYLKREGLTVVMEAPNSGEGFAKEVMRARSSERFRFKPINWRWGVKVS